VKSSWIPVRVCIIKCSSQRILGKTVICPQLIQPNKLAVMATGDLFARLNSIQKLFLIRNIMQIYGQAEEAKDRIQRLFCKY
jgi:hypothetical protein